MKKKVEHFVYLHFCKYWTNKTLKSSKKLDNSYITKEKKGHNSCLVTALSLSGGLLAPLLYTVLKNVTVNIRQPKGSTRYLNDILQMNDHQNQVTQWLV